MLTYKFTVKSLGRITQLLDSQKIFGAIVYLLSNNLEEKKVDQFIEEISNNERMFMVSNLLPDGYLPTPHRDIKDGNKTDYRALKNKKFVPVEQIEKPIREIKEFIEIEEKQDAKYQISDEFFEIPGLKNDLFSIPTIRVLKKKVLKKVLEVVEEVTEFNFYLAFDREDEIILKLLDLLKQLEYDREVFLYGQKASQGYNMYEIKKSERITDLQWENPPCFLNLGMFLPNNKNQIIDYASSRLKLFTSERRPYQMGVGYYGEFKRKDNFISFIEVGSTIKLRSDEDKDKLRHVGKSVSSPYDNKRIIFGQSFLYPLKEDPKL